MGISLICIQFYRYTDAASCLLRWGLAADKCNATHSQCKLVVCYADIAVKKEEKCAQSLLWKGPSWLVLDLDVDMYGRFKVDLVIFCCLFQTVELGNFSHPMAYNLIFHGFIIYFFLAGCDETSVPSMDLAVDLGVKGCLLALGGGGQAKKRLRRKKLGFPMLLHTSFRAYLSAIMVYLYAHDFKQAEKCHNDCCQIDAFLNSDQNRCACKLFSAYTDGDVEEIKRVAQSSAISNLDHMIIRLARKLPTGDVSALKTDAAEGEPLDEDDLT
ncbi:unnamed protein product [Ilex paraguariensis]|uniref:Gamma-soluble NSF attachment protein n=1 Tax=Ilex paraguariensis TaxID=185542 RepID=A0ABC8TDE1_9AQUA